jgi:hypothetical protein
MCVTCHNARLKTAGLVLDQVDVDRVGANREVWEKVAKLRTVKCRLPQRRNPWGGLPWLRVPAQTSLDAQRWHRHTRTVPVHRLNQKIASIRDVLALESTGIVTETRRPDPCRLRQRGQRPVGFAGARKLHGSPSVSRLAVGDRDQSGGRHLQITALLVQDDRTGERRGFRSRAAGDPLPVPLDGEAPSRWC